MTIENEPGEVIGDPPASPEIEAESSPPETPLKRKRGRPPKNPTLNAESVGAAAGASSTGPKKRGAKPSGEKLAAMAKQIQGLHLFAAMGTGIPELQISEQESSMLANAMSDVAAEYGLSVDGKTGAALQLFGAAALIYAPRFLAFKKRVEKERQNAPIVVDMPNATAAN